MASQMNFGDWVAVCTNSITAVTAVIMAILAYQAYLKSPTQQEEPSLAKGSDGEETILKELTVFRTSKQETILKITTQGLECYLEDRRPNKGGHQWTIGKMEAARIVKSSNYYINSGFKVNTGTFSIGQRRNWLYSKKLFPEAEYLRSSIKELLENTSSQNLEKK